MAYLCRHTLQTNFYVKYDCVVFGLLRWIQNDFAPTPGMRATGFTIMRKYNAVCQISRKKLMRSQSIVSPSVNLCK